MKMFLVAVTFGFYVGEPAHAGIGFGIPLPFPFLIWTPSSHCGQGHHGSRGAEVRIRVQVTYNQKQKRRSELRVRKSWPTQFNFKGTFVGSIMARAEFLWPGPAARNHDREQPKNQTVGLTAIVFL
jgi:hypothetical protein